MNLTECNMMHHKHGWILRNLEKLIYAKENTNIIDNILLKNSCKISMKGKFKEMENDIDLLWKIWTCNAPKKKSNLLTFIKRKPG